MRQDVNPFASANFRSLSASPPSGPMKSAMGFESAPRANDVSDPSASTASRHRNPPAVSESQASASGSGAVTSGTRLRPDCSHDGSFREHRDDSCHAELGGLLDDEIHALAARHALQQRHVQRRLAFDGIECTDASPDLLAVALERAREFTAGTVEQRDRRACIESQHAREVQAGLLGQADSLVADELLLDEDASQAHASSTPSVAMRASRSISSGVMT
jgi:hypothetical protein